LESVEIIIHMGAITSTTERNVDLILQNNFVLSRHLWRWAAEHAKRFIYASSAATYGDGSAGFGDDESPAALARLKPLNPYGWSKHLFDQFVAREVARARRAPRQWAGLKFFNVYGPNEYHKGAMKSVVAQIFPKAAGGEAVRLFRSHNPAYEDGGQMRDFVPVDDCAAVIEWLVQTPTVSGLFNMGTGKARSFADLANAVFAALNRRPRIEYVDTPEELRPRYQYFTRADMTKLRRAGYRRAFTELEVGVADYVQRFLAADDPYF
jgi:ADP-L-glycero-D-manno-heptose 6-epimerase